MADQCRASLQPLCFLTWPRGFTSMPEDEASCQTYVKRTEPDGWLEGGILRNTSPTCRTNAWFRGLSGMDADDPI